MFTLANSDFAAYRVRSANIDCVAHIFCHSPCSRCSGRCQFSECDGAFVEFPFITADILVRVSIVFVRLISVAWIEKSVIFVETKRCSPLTIAGERVHVSSGPFGESTSSTCRSGHGHTVTRSWQTQTHTNTSTHAHIHTHAHTRTQTHRHTHKQRKLMHANAHTRTHARRDAGTHARTRARTRTRIRTRTRTRAHTHRHRCSPQAYG